MEEFERNGTNEEVKPSQPIWLSPKRSRTPPLRETSLTTNSNNNNPLRNKFNSYISPIEQSTDSQTFITQDNSISKNFMSFSDRLKAVESSSNDEIDFEDHENEKENNKMADKTSLNEKLSDIVGSSNYKINDKESYYHSITKLDPPYYLVKHNLIEIKHGLSGSPWIIYDKEFKLLGHYPKAIQ